MVFQLYNRNSSTNHNGARPLLSPLNLFAIISQRTPSLSLQCSRTSPPTLFLKFHLKREIKINKQSEVFRKHFFFLFNEYTSSVSQLELKAAFFTLRFAFSAKPVVMFSVRTSCIMYTITRRMPYERSLTPQPDVGARLHHDG